MGREGGVCEGLRGVEGRQCKAACPRVAVNGVMHRRYVVRTFEEIAKTQMRSFDVGVSVELFRPLRYLESCEIGEKRKRVMRAFPGVEGSQ